MVTIISFFIITYVRSNSSISNNLPREQFHKKEKEDVRSISTYSATVTIEEVVNDSNNSYLDDPDYNHQYGSGIGSEEEDDDDGRIDIHRRLLSGTSECE